MISLRRLSGKREGSGEHESREVANPARDAWGVVVEPMTVTGEAVFALSFHRKGTAIYYLHRHYRNRTDAEHEFARITADLTLRQTEFEQKYALDVRA